MPRRVILPIAVLVCVFLLIGFIFLMVLSPVIAILYLVVWMLVGTILWFAWPPLPAAVHEKIDKYRQRIRAKRKAREVTQLVDVSFHVKYQMVNLRDGGAAYPVDREEFMIGRSHDCGLRIKDDQSVSGNHCRIVYRRYSQEYYIEDLNSNVGTYVGSRRLEPYKQEKLLPNAEITIAGQTFRFCSIQ